MTDWTLKKHPTLQAVRGPVVLCVMDGVGCGEHDEADAVWLARTPTLDFLRDHALAARLQAHGTAVGMPSDGDMGNSEVGHNAMGAGRVFDQGAKLVDNAIDSGRLFEGEAWKKLVSHAKQHGQPLHFIGLLSDGNVHSNIGHLIAMLRRCDEEGLERARVHALLDGRDVPETSALTYIDQIESVLQELSVKADRDYRIASGGGRMVITMDRYGANWDMVARGWKTHVHGDERGFASAREAIETLRRENPGTIDQDLPPFVIVDDGRPVGPIEDGASVVLFNFRGDRAIELSRAFEEGEDFDEFDRGRVPRVAFAGMMQYDGDTGLPRQFLVEPPVIQGTVGEYLARNGIDQVAISETQKFGHVTYFWNGNRSGQFDPAHETYVEIPSDRVPFEQRPWMKCAEITDAVIEHLRGGRARHIRLNYANGDMVGHTGKLEAAIIAVEALDLQLARLLPVVEKLGGALLVTADHGNADEMFERDAKSKKLKRDDQGRPRAKTSHTLNPVPLYVYAPGHQVEIDTRIERPGLANLAATLLQLLGYERPEAFEPGLLRAK